MLLLNPRRTRTNMKLLQLVWIFLLTLCGQSAFIKIQVKEDDDVILDCSFGRNIENGAFDWKKDVDKSNEDVFWYSDGQTDPGKDFRGRVSYFPDQLRSGNASIKITKAKTSDSGTYTCYHAITQKEVKSTISLTVGASPKPSIILLHQTRDSALLQCEVLGAFPKPEVVWMDSSGKILPVDEPKVPEPRGKNKFDTVLNITVTKTDHYTCVATQKEIYHQINRTTLVHFNGAASKPSAKPIKNTDNGVLLQCEVFGASPELKIFWKDKAGNLVYSEEQKTETGGGYDIILQTTVTKTDYYRCVTTEGKKDDELYDEIYVQGRGKMPNSWIGGVIGLTGFIAAVVFGVLYLRESKKLCFKGSTTDGSEKNDMI